MEGKAVPLGIDRQGPSPQPDTIIPSKGYLYTMNSESWPMSHLHKQLGFSKVLTIDNFQQFHRQWLVFATCKLNPIYICLILLRGELRSDVDPYT